jgi:NADH-quinone oxidoreductase subunit C/D
MGVELSDRLKYIRTMMDELQRIDSHLLFYSCCAQDLGALTAFIYGMRDREQVLNVMEETTGGRLIQNYYRIGGCQDDIDPGFAKNVKKLCEYLKPMFREYNDIFTGNIILHNRFENVGLLSKEDAISYGCTGGTGRASGWKNDVRKNHPYDMYGQVEFDQISYEKGDCFARYMVRMKEMEQSVRILEQLADNIPAGDFYIKQKPVIRVPEGQWYTSCEGSRGEIGVYLDSKGDKSPYRLKFRPMGLPLVSAMDEILRGEKIADLISVGATLDYVIPDIDR